MRTPLKHGSSWSKGNRRLWVVGMNNFSESVGGIFSIPQRRFAPAFPNARRISPRPRRRSRAIFFEGYILGPWRMAGHWRHAMTFPPRTTLADVGGGSGGMALALTEAYPHLRATVIDLPSVTPITQRFLAEAGVTDRVKVVAADVVNAPVPGTYDVAILRALLQVLSPEDALQALTTLGRRSIPVDASISWGVSSMMRASHPWIRWDSIWYSSISLTKDVPTPKASIARGSQRLVLQRLHVSLSPKG